MCFKALGAQFIPVVEVTEKPHIVQLGRPGSTQIGSP